MDAVFGSAETSGEIPGPIQLGGLIATPNAQFDPADDLKLPRLERHHRRPGNLAPKAAPEHVLVQSGNSALKSSRGARKRKTPPTQGLGELQGRAKYQASAAARDIARRTYKRAGLPRRCLLCGYSRHAEVCHIRAIKDFPPSVTIAEVNAIGNLVPLCPNHHWELDHDVVSPATLVDMAADVAKKALGV